MRKTLVLLLAAAVSAWGWGDKGHTMLPELALKLLPPEVPVLRDYSATVIDAGPEPDRWRSGNIQLKDAQEPDHFINWEQTAFLPELPPVRHRFIEAVYAEAARSKRDLKPEVIGYQPYIALEVFERLRVAFGDYAMAKQFARPAKEFEQRIAFYAGWLSHYVSDMAQPLHATVHHDGWTGENPRGFPTARGIHSRLETAFVDANISAADVSAVPAKLPPIGDLWKDYQAYIRHTFTLVERTYELDKAGAFTGAGTPEGKRFVVERLAAGRDMLAAVWLAAWKQSQWEGCIPYTDAPARASQVGCVSGKVLSTSPSSSGGTYLNFCADYRTCPFSVQVRGIDPEALKGKSVQFTGRISISTAGRPIMYLSDPRQVRAEK